MIKYLITGGSGFVGKHFTDHILNNYSEADILNIDISESENMNIKFEKLDLLDNEKLSEIISKYKPDRILHLASFSSVAFSWRNPVKSFANNTNIFLNLLEAVRSANINPRIISVGSSEEYGNLPEENYPLTESTKVNPVSPYAVARVSQEMLSRVYVNGYGLDIIMTRSFNHIGPYQKEVFVVPSFVKQFAEAKLHNKTDIDLITGDISVSRDFVDVRDVVKAYELLFQKGESGELYNICSGKPTKLKEIINILSEITGIKANINISDDLLRPTDIKQVYGENKKINDKTGWQPEIKLTKSIEDMLEVSLEEKR